jgi:hypothetical protein
LKKTAFPANFTLRVHVDRIVLERNGARHLIQIDQLVR